jgi:acyl-CoA synthetase (AMP-forming)/AMP-acid ligase II
VRNLDGNDVVLGALPMSHIFGVATILLTSIHAGAAVKLQSRFDAASTLRALQEGRLTALHGVPTLYTRLLDELEREDLHGPFPTLRYAYAGGGALDLELKRHVERSLGLPLHHGYGMTEYAGSMFVTHVDRPRDDALPGERAPDCEVRFVGEDGIESRPGEPGEIWVRGPGTMLGYYRNPVLTQQTITPDGWLRTGDLGYLEADGALRIVSRARDLIKRSGFTVYPLEVEQQLTAHPAVRQAAVVGVPGEGGDEQIVAFVEAHPPAVRLNQDELIAFARERLSAYKCPQHVVQVAELPLTPNGKVRKQDLLALWQGRT